MASDRLRRVFTLRDMFALVTVIGLLLAVLVPMISSAQARARRNMCTNKLKGIGLAVQCHSDVFNRLPAVAYCQYPGSTNVWNTAPGATFSPGCPMPNGYAGLPAQAAGYSWIVRILPYLEQNPLYNAVGVASGKYSYEAFSTTGAGGAPFTMTIGGTARHFATIRLDEVICPDYRGDWISTASNGTASRP